MRKGNRFPNTRGFLYPFVTGAGKERRTGAGGLGRYSRSCEDYVWYNFVELLDVFFEGAVEVFVEGCFIEPL